MSTTTPHAAVDTVRQFYDLVNSGDFEKVSRLLHADLVIRESRALPFGGDYHGPAGFHDIMGRIVEMADIGIVGGPIEFLGASNPVVVRFTGRFTSRVSGESAETRIVELFTVRDGQIVELDIYYKDPSAVAAALVQ